MASITRTVEKAHPGDAGRSVCRLGSATIDTLGVVPGDVVILEGSSSTTANVWRLRGDEDEDIVRIGHHLRDNADVEIGGNVTISKATPSSAEVVTISFVEGDKEEFTADASDWLTANLTSRPVSDGDVLPVQVPVPAGSQPPLQRSTIVCIEETAPAGVVLVDEHTEWRIQG